MKVGCISTKTKEFSNSKIINLEKNSFKNDALIFKDLKSKKVSLKNTLNDKCIHICFGKFEYIGFWAPIDASFVCIEPWCGIADYENTNHQLEDKVGIIKLNKNEIFERVINISFE